MNKHIFLFFLVVMCQLSAQEDLQTGWFDRWLSGMTHFGSENYDEAIKDYSQAINLRESEGKLKDADLYLYNDRGQAYLLCQRFDEAVYDFTKVLDVPEVPVEQKIRALWGRATCYATMDEYDEFNSDYENLKITDPNYPKVEFTKEYVIFRNFDGSRFSDHAKDRFRCSMIHMDICKAKEDVVFTRTGVCLVKRRCQCGCEKSKQEQIFEQEHGKQCNSCGETIRLGMARYANKRDDDCKYWCDRLAQTAFVLCGTTFATLRCKIYCTALVEAIKEGCHWCCEGGEFYKKCVEPYAQYIFQVPCDPQFD